MTALQYLFVYKADKLSPASHTPSYHADHGCSSPSRLTPYDEPHPYRLHGRRDIESTRRQSWGDNPLYDISYQERARRCSQAYGQLPLHDEPGPSHATQNNYDNLPPRYDSCESPPPYTSVGESQEGIENMVPTQSGRGYDNHDTEWRQTLLSSRCRR